MAHQTETREEQTGVRMPPPGARAVQLTGTPDQVEWAERIRGCVNEDFDRVARSFRVVAEKQNAAARADTYAIIAILEEKRADVLSKDRAGYFIHDWQEIGDQIRQMIFHDSRYQAIKNNRLEDKRSPQAGVGCQSGQQTAAE